jgi:hypothetical protein
VRRSASPLGTRTGTRLVGGGGGRPISPVSFDGVSSNVTLSNGSLTVTNAAGSGLGGARSAATKSSGKYYFEITATQISGDFKMGILPAGNSYTDMANRTGTFTIERGNGLVYVNGGFQMNTGTLANGTTIAFAIDFSILRCYIYRNGAWNFGADPTLPNGGFLFPSGSYSPALIFNGGTNGDNAVANFGATAYTLNVKPSGFSNWPP